MVATNNAHHHTTQKIHQNTHDIHVSCCPLHFTQFNAHDVNHGDHPAIHHLERICFCMVFRHHTAFNALVFPANALAIHTEKGHIHAWTLTQMRQHRRESPIERLLRIFTQVDVPLAYFGRLPKQVLIPSQGRERHELGGTLLHGHGPVPFGLAMWHVDDVVVPVGGFHAHAA